MIQLDIHQEKKLKCYLYLMSYMKSVSVQVIDLTSKTRKIGEGNQVNSTD